MPKTESKQQLGERGEDLGCAELGRQGMQVLERNWRCRLGEIDIGAEAGSSRSPQMIRVGAVIVSDSDGGTAVVSLQQAVETSRRFDPRVPQQHRRRLWVAPLEVGERDSGREAALARGSSDGVGHS